MITIWQNRRVRVAWVQVHTVSDKIRSNLFFVPLLYVIGAIALAESLISVDARPAVTDVPQFMRTTVDGGRN